MTDAPKPLVPTKTDTFSETSGSAIALGGQVIATSRGLIGTVDAPGFTTMLINRETPAECRVGLMLYQPPEPGEDMGYGLISQMNRAEALQIAESLTRLAAQLPE